MSTTQTYIATEWTWYFLDSTLHVRNYRRRSFAAD